MIKYPQRALKGLVHLFRPYNDIEVYVEDSLNRNMYEVLLERMLAGKARVKRVFPLHGRDEVLKHCRLDQVKSARRRIYIVDGDFSIYFGPREESLKHLYQLNVYTSENLLVSESASIEVAYESMTEIGRREVQDAIAIGDLITEAVGKLRPLYVLYAAKHFLEHTDKKKIHIETTGTKIVNLANASADGLEVCNIKINQRISAIRSELVKNYGYTRATLLALEESIDRSLPNDPSEFHKYISGKTYLLPLIFHRLSKVAKCRTTIEQLKVRLARFAELDIDGGLLAAVDLAAKG